MIRKLIMDKSFHSLCSLTVCRFFFHYSGHGGRVQDMDGDEDDGFDETIYPVDHDQYEDDSGQIVDDVRHVNLLFSLDQLKFIGNA